MKEFKLIVAGGRDFNDYALMDASINQVLSELADDLVVSIVSGKHKTGVDAQVSNWATIHQCTHIPYYAPYREYGARAVYIHNDTMAKDSSGLLAFYDGADKQTAHLIAIARAKDLYVKVIKY